MWNGGIINVHDGHDLVNVVFQFKHSNTIIIGLKMSSPFRDLHREDIKKFITSAIRAIESFLIREERLLKLNDTW
jgi:hypothetical protein